MRVRKHREKYFQGHHKIGNPLNALCQKTYDMTKDGAVGHYLSNYDAVCERYKRAALTGHFVAPGAKADKYTGIAAEAIDPTFDYHPTDSIKETLTDRFARAFDSSRIIMFFSRIKKALLSTALPSCGMFTISFALFMLISQLALLLFSLYHVELPVFSFLTESNVVLTSAFIVAAVLLIPLSLSLLFASNVSLYDFLLDSRVVGSILRNFLGIRNRPAGFSAQARNGGHVFVLGMFFGLLTFLVPPYYLAAVCLLILLCAIILTIPESGLCLSVFLLPFYPLLPARTYFAPVLIGLVLLSTVVKLLRGKRGLRLEPADLFIILFLLLVGFGGIVTYGGLSSFLEAQTFLLFGFTYFSVTVLIKSEGWLLRCLASLQYSSVVVAILYGVDWLARWQGARHPNAALWKWLVNDALPFSENSTALALFLVTAFFVSLGLLISAQHFFMRFQSVVTMLAVILNLAAIKNVFVGLVLVVVVAFLWLIRTPKAQPWVFLLVAAAVSVFFLPVDLRSRIAGFFGFSHEAITTRWALWQAGSGMARLYFLPGIGIGASAFSAAFSGFTTPVLSGASDIGNFFFQILLSLGAPGLMVFLILLMLVARSVFSCFRKCGLKNKMAWITLSLLGVLTAMLLIGCVSYLWSDARSFYLFWFVLGLISAGRRLALQTKTGEKNESDACDLEFVLARRKGKKIARTNRP